MVIFEFKTPVNRTNTSTFLKVILPGKTDLGLELNEVLFDLYFENIDYPNKDVTVNWHIEDFEWDGVFYTDANALQMMKRETDSYIKKANKTTSQRASSNYYPINAGIIVEDTKLGEQIIISNDRCAGASAFRNGTIEIMLNRRGTGVDDLGNIEPMDEYFFNRDEKTGEIKYTRRMPL